MAAKPRTLREAELNRALLARQLLLERAKVSIPKALERMGTLQAQYAPSMYIGLWSRLEGFEREALTRALERRSVVQGTLMRVTIHLVSKADYWPIAEAIRKPRREGWLKATHRQAMGATPSEFERLARRLRRKLADGPMSRKEIDSVHGKGSVWTNGAGVFLDMVRIPPSGTWERRRADLYAAAEEWIGPSDSSPEEGAELLVRRYLTGFAPAAPKDIADWAGLPLKQIEAALEGMRTRSFRDEAGTALVDLPRAPLPDPKTPAPVRFLPTWDATLLAHARRTGILPEEHRPRVFNVKTPQSVSTFLVDGRVAGSWRYEKGRVKLEPFKKLDRSTRAELDEEAERLAELHA